MQHKSCYCRMCPVPESIRNVYTRDLPKVYLCLHEDFAEQQQEHL